MNNEVDENSCNSLDALVMKMDLFTKEIILIKVANLCMQKRKISRPYAHTKNFYKFREKVISLFTNLYELFSLEEKMSGTKNILQKDETRLTKNVPNKRTPKLSKTDARGFRIAME